MKPKFIVADGCQVADLIGIHEGYSVRAAEGFSVFTINVSAPNIPTMFLQLSQLVQEPVFFVIEVGTHRDVEATLRKNDADPFHTDVYYLDGLSQKAAQSLFQKYDQLLTHDGGVKFGIGSHVTKHDEVFVDGYKVFSVYTIEPQKYHEALTNQGFDEKSKIKTVWNTFTKETPGSRSVLKGGARTIYDMIEELKKEGLYLSGRRDD
jgi:hypothetical protein